jgi:catechol 2,3-dioxygenase-like lactoylglutathione lyase family enzyme
MLVGMSPTLTHLALQVHDLERSIEFYGRFCGLQVVHERRRSEARVVWLAEPGRDKEFIFVLLQGPARRPQEANDYSHLGFAVASKDEVDAIAERAKRAGCLSWPPRQEPFPVGYYCGLKDPDGNMVEFSFGQPLGPGALVADTDAKV